MEVAQAICASIAIPFIFTPVYIDDFTYIDGGIIDTIPVLPFMLKDPAQIYSYRLTMSELDAKGFMGYSKKLINMYMKHRHEYNIINEKTFDISHVNTVDFNMSEEEKLKLYYIGCHK